MSDEGRAAIRRTVVTALLAATAAGAVTAFMPAALRPLDLAAHDAFVRQTPPPTPSSRVAVVAVDEASLTALGQWPWPRDVIARLVTRLHEAGASAIAFDILFPESDRLGGGPGEGPTTDDVLATAFAQAPVVTGVALTFDGAGANAAGCALTPVEPVLRHRSDGDPLAALFRATGAVCSMHLLGRAAQSTGTINVSPDADGVLRRVPVLTRLDERVFPALALAAVLRAHPEPLVVVQGPDGGLTTTLSSSAVALDPHGHVLLRARGHGRAYPYHSAIGVLDGSVPASDLAGRLVFVGATALGVRDTAATPLDPRFPGVEVHATLADTFLGGATAVRPPSARALEVGGAALGAFLAALLVTALGTSGGVALSAAAGAGTWFGLRAWFAASGAVVSPAGPFVGLVLGAATGLVGDLAFERRRAGRERHRREQAQRLIVQTLTSLTETRDVETGRHARRTQEYTRLLATTMAARGAQRAYLTPHRIDLIATLAPLHDIGKVGISDAVLHKPGALTDAEYTEMKRHTSLGHDTLQKAEALAGVHDDEVLGLAKDIVFTHHERWDGSGYPRGLRAEAIPLPGRIVAVVDTYDALVAERTYKKAMPHEEALAIIVKGRGTHFDPDVVDAFEACHAGLRDAKHALDVRLPAGRR